MLAELAAFNAAFKVIKTTVSNSGDLAKCISQIATVVGVKSDLKEKIERKRSGFLGRLKGTTANDLEEFQALEQVRQAEEQLREIMIWAGRPGLWTDWQKYQVEARKRRAAQKEEERLRNEAIIFWTGIVGLIVVVVGGLAGLIYWARFLGGLDG
jgi:hypothetical protein|tara:strand:+ start:448 stop:912 length:465 start_codon:yes stop_codon:yes gene_type:complete